MLHSWMFYMVLKGKQKIWLGLTLLESVLFVVGGGVGGGGLFVIATASIVTVVIVVIIVTIWPQSQVNTCCKTEIREIQILWYCKFGTSWYVLAHKFSNLDVLMTFCDLRKDYCLNIKILKILLSIIFWWFGTYSL